MASGWARWSSFTSVRDITASRKSRPARPDGSTAWDFGRWPIETAGRRGRPSPGRPSWRSGRIESSSDDPASRGRGATDSGGGGVYVARRWGSDRRLPPGWAQLMLVDPSEVTDAEARSTRVLGTNARSDATARPL